MTHHPDPFTAIYHVSLFALLCWAMVLGVTAWKAWG